MTDQSSCDMSRSHAVFVQTFHKLLSSTSVKTLSLSNTAIKLSMANKTSTTSFPDQTAGSQNSVPGASDAEVGTQVRYCCNANTVTILIRSMNHNRLILKLLVP